MKRLITIIIATLITMPCLAQSSTFQQNGISYRIENNEAVVCPYSDYQELNSDYYKGVIRIPDQITYQGRQYPVTSIAPRTFMLCHEVTEVFIPNSVTTIGDEAFKNDNCFLEQVHIGAGVREIGHEAFYCTHMSNMEVDAANSHFCFDASVLYTADHKRAITVGAPQGDWDSLDPDIVLHEDVEVIDNGFCMGRRLNTLKFGNKLKWIGEFAFQYSLSETFNQRDLILPDGITYIGRRAFDECIRIDNLHLPDSLTRLEEGSFCYVAPDSIHMPKNLKVICDYALSCIAGGVFRNLVLPEGLDSIGEYGILCIGCDSLIIPSTLRHLSFRSLDNFSKYIEIRAPLDSIPCGAMPSQGVKELILPKTLTKLGDYALYPCYNLQRIVWPDSLTYIGDHAMAGNKLSPMVVPSTVTYLGGCAFSDNVWEPRTYYFTSPTPPTCGNVYVFDGIYYDESTLYVPRGSKLAYAGKAPWSWFGTLQEYDEIVIPPTPTRYDFEADGIYYNILSDQEQTCEVSYDRNYITDKNTYTYRELTIPSSVSHDGKTYTVTSIEHSAFSATPLQQIHLPQTITSLQGAFYGCSDLESIEIPDNVINLDAAFAYCDKLQTIHLPEKVESISGAFYHCSNLESVNIPASVQDISGAFSGCKRLTSIELPDHITQTGQETFWGCNNLTSVKIPAQLTTIDKSAFSSCTSLTRIVLPSQLTYIMTGAFNGCTSLDDIISLNPTPPYVIGYSNFDHYQTTIHVPAGSKEAYQNATGWSNFANIVEDAEAAASIHQPHLRPATTRHFDILGRPVSPQYRGFVITK